MERLNGGGRQPAGQGETLADRLREELRAWREVAAEREQACEELERINHWLEQENQRLEAALEKLREEKLTAEEAGRAEEAALQPLSPPPPPTLKRCLAHYL